MVVVMAVVNFRSNNRNNFTIIAFQFNSNMRILTQQQFDDFEEEVTDLFQKKLQQYSD